MFWAIMLPAFGVQVWVFGQGRVAQNGQTWSWAKAGCQERANMTVVC